MTRFGLVTAEIVDPIFSGNGVASRSVARCLLRRPQDSLLVVCGRPAGKQEESPGDDLCEELSVERVDAELAAAIGAIVRVRACAPPASVRT